MSTIYKFIEQENGKILLKQIDISQLTNHTKTNLDNGDILLTPIKNVTVTNLQDIPKYDFKQSTITKCIINNTPHKKLKYKSILNTIYETINDGTTIIKHTKLNIKTINKTDEGFYYLDKLGISVQGVDANKSVYEIVNQCHNNNVILELVVKMVNGMNVTFKV
ncbi:hypothetical protein Klosneuvirus_10_3 [Klosneuvirus KNV1]|uniref:Uncharacterized protein n=1 Tax=Klosneuvirus KNV1 TaxID=1977640 RepID=A0A1V0SLW9_9VIRU|nr:hypothetical protein Klosneuvirus_10_3 [Klosneuvirus KNV1]